MKPEWNKLKEKVAGTPGTGSLIELDSNVIPQINYKPLTQKIQGFPTILIIKQGIPKMEYTGERSFNDMFQYFKKNLSHHSSLPRHSNTMNRSPYPHLTHYSSPQNMSTVVNEDEPTSKKTRKRKRKSRQKGGSKKNRKKRKHTR